MKISIPIQRRCKHFKTPAPKGPGKRGHIVADTLLLMMFLGLRKLGNICRGHKMFLNKITFFVSRTQNLCPQQMLPVQANGETLVSATMCPQQCVLVCQTTNKHYWHHLAHTFKSMVKKGPIKHK